MYVFQFCMNFVEQLIMLYDENFQELERFGFILVFQIFLIYDYLGFYIYMFYGEDDVYYVFWGGFFVIV